MNHHAVWTIVAAASVLGACSSRVIERTEVIREQPTAQSTAPGVVERVTIVQPPAAPAETMPPAPSTGYSWVAGHYEWRDNRWTWIPGQWIPGTVRPMPAPMSETQPPPPSDVTTARWVPGYWSFNGSDWVWVRGRWLYA